MKRTGLLLLCSIMIISARAQPKTGDTALDRRLQEYISISRALQFEPLMAYIHPALFRIVPKESVIEAYHATFDQQEFKLAFRDIIVRSASPSFQYQRSQYRKVVYYTVMSITLRDTALCNNQEYVTYMLDMLRKGFPDKEIAFNQQEKNFSLAGDEILYAILDPGEQWMFVGYKKQPQLLKLLYPQAVINHFKMI